MNIQRSSFARLDTDTENQGRSVNESVKEGFYGKMKTLENWRKTVLLACVVALAIDPLFLFIPEINSDKTCFTFNKELGVAVCVLRTFIDIFYEIHFLCPFKTKLTGQSWRSLKGVLNVLSKAKRKKRILFYLIVDIGSILPFPQVVVLRVILRSTSLVSKSLPIRITKWIIVGQYLPRIIRIYPLYKEVTKTSGTIAESNWIGATLNLFLFMLCSYVFGAFWYVNGVQKKSSCWRAVCAANITGCNPTKLLCPLIEDVDNSLFLNTSCPLVDPDDITNLKKNSSTNSSNVYDFGMYIEVLKSGVAEEKPRDFPRRFVYCFWWGLRNLSTFAQSVKPGNSVTDIFFAIIICASGLFLFAVLIGNVQKYMISTIVRVEEMKERQRDTETWMSSRNLTEDLKERIRKYNTYKWQKFRGTEEDALLRSLPKELRLETKRQLYKNLSKHVSSLFVGLPETMNDWLLGALCDRVKSVYYSANSYIVREGDPVEEILIVTKGELECKTKYGDRYNTSKHKEGDICGDLHFWIRNPTPSPHHLPTSNRTVMALTDVEGFILLPDDLKFVASHLGQPRSECSSSSEPQKSADPEISKDEAKCITEGNVSDEIKSVKPDGINPEKNESS